MDPFVVLADPVRRDVLAALLAGERDVGALVAALGASQPNVSKHLRVLREHGWVQVRVDGPRRVYRLADAPPPHVEEWLTPFRARWAGALDRLGQHLDADRSPTAARGTDHPGTRSQEGTT